MILYVLSLLAALILFIVTNIHLLLWRRRMNTYGYADHVSVTPEKPELPDAALEDEKPVLYPVGRKHIHLHPMTQSEFKRFAADLALLLSVVHAQASGLKLIAVLDPKGEQAHILDGWAANMFSRRVDRIQNRIIRRSILWNKKMNPEKVRMRDIRDLSLPRLIGLWQMLYARNVNAVEDFTSSLMTSLAGTQERVKAGSDLLNAGLITRQSGQPLYQNKFFGAGDSASAPPAKTTA